MGPVPSKMSPLDTDGGSVPDLASTSIAKLRDGLANWSFTSVDLVRVFLGGFGGQKYDWKTPPPPLPACRSGDPLNVAPLMRALRQCRLTSDNIARDNLGGKALHAIIDTRSSQSGEANFPEYEAERSRRLSDASIAGGRATGL